MKKGAFLFPFVISLVVPLLCAKPLAAESRSLAPEEGIGRVTPREGHPGLPLPPADKTIVPPPPQAPTVPPFVPENRGAFNPRTGERYPPSGKGVFNPATGEYYPPSGNGYINPRTGEHYPRIGH